MALTNRTKPCTVEQCDKHQVSRGLCNNHYKKREELGLTKYRDTSIASRFWNHVLKGEAEACWPWDTAIARRGYGNMSVGKSLRKATHISLFLHTGNWPTHDVLHSCDYPPCVNPSHLREGTHLENMHEAIERGRFGEQQGRNFAKLTKEQAAEIRQRSTEGEELKSLAAEFKVSFQTVWRIRENMTWKNTHSHSSELADAVRTLDVQIESEVVQ